MRLFHVNSLQLLACCVGIYFIPLHAEEAPVNFEGQTIEFIVPFKTGGGSDVWARFVAPYLSRYLPGQPAVVIKNVPGGNSSKAANLFAEFAKPDGLSILGTSASTQLSFLLGDSRVKYDFKDWRGIMAYSAGGIVYGSNALNVKDIHELIDSDMRNLLFYSLGPTSLDIFVLLSFDLLEMNVNSIFGLRGRGPARKSFFDGETALDFQTTSAYLLHLQPMAESGQVIPLFSLGAFDENNNYIRDPEFPQLPNVAEVYEYVHGQPPSGEMWQAWLSLYSVHFSVKNLLVVPKDTPDNIAKAYAQAIVDMQLDPEFIASRGKHIGRFGLVGGPEAEQLYGRSVNISTETVAWLKAWIFKRYQVKL